MEKENFLRKIRKSTLYKGWTQEHPIALACILCFVLYIIDYFLLGSYSTLIIWFFVPICLSVAMYHALTKIPTTQENSKFENEPEYARGYLQEEQLRKEGNAKYIKSINNQRLKWVLILLMLELPLFIISMCEYVYGDNTSETLLSYFIIFFILFFIPSIIAFIFFLCVYLIGFIRNWKYLHSYHVVGLVLFFLQLYLYCKFIGNLS